MVVSGQYFYKFDELTNGEVYFFLYKPKAEDVAIMIDFQFVSQLDFNSLSHRRLTYNISGFFVHLIKTDIQTRILLGLYHFLHLQL